MELLQFNTKLTSDTEIKIPENIKSKIEINKEVFWRNKIKINKPR